MARRRRRKMILPLLSRPHIVLYIGITTFLIFLTFFFEETNNTEALSIESESWFFADLKK